MKSLSKTLYILVFSALVSCKKGSVEPTLTLTGTDSGKTVSVSKGEIIILTLGNPGDGGYQFISPFYDGSVLTLNSHTHQNPANPNLMGDAGQDTWKFTSVATGITTLKISASRGGVVRDTTALFSSQITIK